MAVTLAPDPEGRRPRRNREVRLRQYFMTKGVGTEAAHELGAASELHRHTRGVMTVNHGPFIEIMLAGVVTDRDQRLWGSDWWLGDINMFRESQRSSRMAYEFVSISRTIRIPREVLRSWAMRDLSVQRMLHEAMAHRFEVLEAVYGLDHRPPPSRVAALLLYLLDRSSSARQAGVIQMPDDVLHGPTQRHMAVALGLSLATVEKCLSLMRKSHVLKPSGRGRAHRSYVILNPELLAAVAQGAALPSD